MFSPRQYIVAKTDHTSDRRIKELEKDSENSINDVLKFH